MGRTLHDVAKLTLLVMAAFIAAPASAECINPLITPTECDFKNEDTHLWLNQPGHYHQRERNLESLIEDTKKGLTDYVANIKTTGDAHIVSHLATVEAAINGATVQAAASIGILLANDPFQLKTLYLDVTRCFPYWSILFDETCPTTAELPLLLEKTRHLTELQNVVDQIRANPFKVLGEEWGDIADDINEIKAEFNRGQTLARNLGTVAKGTELDIRFHSLGEMLAAPRMNYATLEAKRKELSATVQDTLVDTLQAGSRASQGQRVEDRAEIERLHSMGRNAIGMMQELEIENMHKINAAGAWAKISEQQMNMGNLIGVEMADELYTENRQAAEDERIMAVDPLNPTVIGDEPAPFFR